MMKPLKVIDDLTISFRKLGISSDNYETKIRKEIVSPFRHDLERFFDDIIFIPLDVIHSNINIKQRDQRYLVTLEEGVYFPNYDYSLSLTRTATNKNDFSNGPYILCPRDGYPSLEYQAYSLAVDYKRNGESKPIVICDDSVGKFGLTLKVVIELLRKFDLQVIQIYVLVNANGMKSLLDVEIDSYLLNTYTINERDLYWGLPLSGISCIKDSQMLGVPTSIDIETIRNRIYPLPVDKLVDFRKCVLEFNIKFWTLIENYFNKQISFYDCSRLKGFPNFFGIPNERIINFLIRSILSN